MFNKMFLTGIRRSWRLCPTHGAELEMYIDDGPGNIPDSERLLWLCEECGCLYSETLFIEDAKRRQIRDMKPRLRLACPACASWRVDHACDPGCCDEHICHDCGAVFNITCAKLESGHLSVLPLSNGGENVDKSFFLCATFNSRFDRTGLVRQWRRCPTHKDHDMELCLMVGPYSDDSRISWLCDRCGNLFTENFLRGHSRPTRRVFTPMPRCPECGSLDLANTDRGEGILSCNGCGAVLAARFYDAKSKR